MLKVVDSGFLAEGAVIKEFETACRDSLGCDQAIFVSDCTVGLAMALRATGIGPGDEVIVSVYT